MSMSMRIAGREINAHSPPYIIAELGVNHDGSVERALDLVDAAAGAGADAIKLQLFDADLLMSRAAKLAMYQKAAGEADPIEMLRRLQLSAKEMKPVIARARARGLHAIVTVFSPSLVKSAERLGFDAYKVASPDLVNRPLLRALNATGRPLILSTGAATLAEVRRTVEWIGGAGVRKAERGGGVGLLQCVSSYPTREADAAIGAMTALRIFASHSDFEPVIGYSDHTAAVDTGALAVACGACILEKHLTHDRRGAGPDHAASLDAAGLAEYVRLAHRARAMVGAREGRMAGAKRVLPCERDVRRVSRQSVVAAGAIPRGRVITAADLTVKRPGTGISAWMFDEVVGRKTARAIPADTPLVMADLAPASISTPPTTGAAGVGRARRRARIGSDR